MVRWIPACVVVSCLFVGSIAPSGAAAAKIPLCGSIDRDGNTVLGSLALDDNSATTRTYGTAKGDRHLALLYSVTGCTLPRGTMIAPEQVSILPPKAGDDLPREPTVSITVAKPDPTAIEADVALKLDDIDPGTHGGIVRIHMPQYLHDSFTPISESRTDWWLWPVLLGLAGSVAGVSWAVALHRAETIKVDFSPMQGLLVGALAIGAGLVAGYGYWHNQDVWTLGDNGWATIVSGFTASTTGALAGVTAALFSPKKEDSPDEQPPAVTPPVTPSSSSPPARST